MAAALIRRADKLCDNTARCRFPLAVAFRSLWLSSPPDLTRILKVNLLLDKLYSGFTHILKVNLDKLYSEFTRYTERKLYLVFLFPCDYKPLILVHAPLTFVFWAQPLFNLLIYHVIYH